MKLRNIAIVLSVLGLMAACGGGGNEATVPKAQPAEATFADIGSHIVHFSAQSTDLLPKEVARAYDIIRSKNRAMLNVSIIEKDSNKSKEFLDKFADVYRFLLKSKGSELTSVQQELEFLGSYMYLINTRFGDNVSWNLDLSCSPEDSFIPPLTLQMLFENGIFATAVGREH